jgi:hypothetical protein
MVFSVSTWFVAVVASYHVVKRHVLRHPMVSAFPLTFIMPENYSYMSLCSAPHPTSTSLNTIRLYHCDVILLIGIRDTSISTGLEQRENEHDRDHQHQTCIINALR